MTNQILELKKDNAIAAYNAGDAKEKSLLEKLYGKQHFITDICERVTGLEDACRETGKDYQAILSITDPYKQAQEAIETFAEAMREGKDPSECFYYPYFYRGGGGFSFFVYGLDGDVCSVVGARLRVDTAKKATHMGNCILIYYKTYINGN
jgi:hypothetical protein